MDQKKLAIEEEAKKPKQEAKRPEARPNEKELVNKIAHLRSLQRSFFATRNRAILVELSPLESQIHAWLQQSTAATDPIAWDLFEKCKAMLINQAAWIQARHYATTLPADTSDDSRKRAAQKATLLEGTCKKLERATDKAIEELRRPTLPGLGEP